VEWGSREEVEYEGIEGEGVRGDRREDVRIEVEGVMHSCQLSLVHSALFILEVNT
jgi:hypothetical protein